MSETDAPGGVSALVLGATGLVGGHLLDLLLDDPAYGRVVVLGRREADRRHPKLEQRTGDLGRMEEHAEAFRVSHVFCALGTTLRSAGSREAFRRVDRDYVVASARVAAAEGAERYLLVSSAGVSPRSPFFYSRVKAEAEDGVLAQALPSATILRPSQLLGERDERRPAEAAAQRVMRALAPLFRGPLRRYRAVPARTVARAMLRLAREAEPGARLVENDEILTMGGA
jgi:uncharacterized protein YbjT (DUF2867 family)